MSPWFFTLLLLYRSVDGSMAEGAREVSSVCGQDCVLHCGADAEPGVRYRAVRWYKVSQNSWPHLSGLLTRNLTNGVTHWYNSTHLKAQPVLLGDSYNIRLSNVTCADSGRYICHLAAPVGDRNSEGEILLKLTDCPESGEETAMNDSFMAILATFVLIFALFVFGISYVCLKNTIRERSRTKQKLLEATLRPLEAKDLMLIYRLGPKPKTKHICV
ncbi:CD83 antigen [Takifugu rubripes]|uniref:Ig-like domain-containing protein n=1 Tax=Takifugu rubripes TaxID=31033 RepID=A0A3B5KUQ1_TAKRU|nr:CD83 antigen [Takifugu rubripes]|eukprot:XP_011617162.1 PREDICTED: CD83 antigen [Takifugu rubripes]